jgi:MFS transporter, FHS family, glucose/mannose:H+ symporter
VPDARANSEKPIEARVANASLTPILIAATFMTLFSVGMIGSSWGSAVSFIKLRFLISDASVGLLGSAQSLGGVLGNIATGFLEKRFQAGSRMAIGVALFGAGCLLFFVSQMWFFALASVLLLGFGLGMFQVDYATLFSRGFGKRSGAVMNVMSTSFSFGSIVGPLVVVWLLERFGLMFLAVAVFAAAVVLVMLPARDTVLERTSGSSLKLNPKLIGFVAMCLFYVCAEQGVSFWMPSYLQSIGFDLAQSARVASWFWQALTVGRFLSIPLSLRFSSATLIVGCLLLSFMALLLAQIPSLATPAFVAAGLFFAPVFPTGLVWINREYSSVAASSVFLVAGSVGALLIAPLLGVLKQVFGASVIPLALAACALLALCASIWLRTMAKAGSNSV